MRAVFLDKGKKSRELIISIKILQNCKNAPPRSTHPHCPISAKIAVFGQTTNSQ